MKIQITRADFLIMCQEYISYYFPDAKVRTIEFIKTDNSKAPISRVEVDFHKEVIGNGEK